MSVENRDVIDLIHIEDRNVILSISDHLEWDSKNEHLLILQDKINAYLESIEGEDLYERYPKIKGKNIVIRVVALHNPNDEANEFLKRVKETLQAAGYDFQFNQRTLNE